MHKNWKCLVNTLRHIKLGKQDVLNNGCPERAALNLENAV